MTMKNRVGVLLGLWVAGAAFAAPTKGKVARDDDDDPIVKPAAAPTSSEADIALLRALLWATEPAPTEIRVLAVEDLGLLGDPRALNPLAELLIDPNPAVQAAALRSIATLRYPRSEEILTNVARHPTLPERLKLAAVDLVLFQNTNSAIAFLKYVAKGTSFTFNLQNAAKKALADVPPARVEASR